MYAKTTNSENSPFVSERNACKLCAPLGASIAFRGIEGCVPLVHGSQGCATYIRRYIISHFREPVDIASSNFGEQTVIFGGGDNLKTAIDNVISQYNPQVIGISSTCLSETIGDDVSRYINEYRNSRGNNLPVLLHASTPGYRGTHMEGYRSALYAVVNSLAEEGKPSGRINLISPFVSPGDIRHLKEILESFGMPYTIFPDCSETLDGESWEEYELIPKGGTSLEDIRLMGSASATIETGGSVRYEKSISSLLKERFNIRGYSIGLPIGIEACDIFFKTLEVVTGREIPEIFLKERGRLVDAYIDAHKYLFDIRVIVYGEADLAGALALFLDETGARTILCATGACNSDVNHEYSAMLESRGILLCDDTDFATMYEYARELKPDLVVGNSKGAPLAKDLGIPLVRCGFPVHDRFGGQRLQLLGYRGTTRLLDCIVNAVLEARQEKNNIGYSYM